MYYLQSQYTKHNPTFQELLNESENGQVLKYVRQYNMDLYIYIYVYALHIVCIYT